jgi:hypothetical protein
MDASRPTDGPLVPARTTRTHRPPSSPRPGRQAAPRFTLTAERLPRGAAHLPQAAADGVSRLREADGHAAEALPFPDVGYRRHVLQEDAEAEVIACTWSPGQGTPLHGHGASQTVTRVLEGTVLEERFLPDGRGRGFRYELVELGPGSWSHAGLGVVHRVWGLDRCRTLQCTTPFNGTPVVPVDAAAWPLLDEARSRFFATGGLR